MTIKVLLTVGMWMACAKYHPTFGIRGTEIKGATFPEQLVDLGRGWEWWPSLVWQFIWSWIVSRPPSWWIHSTTHVLTMLSSLRPFSSTVHGRFEILSVGGRRQSAA